MKFSANGVAVNHYFESCRLVAYPDPGSKRADGGPWTCGWGQTGPDIVKGTVWTQAQADARFLDAVVPREAAVMRLVKVPLTQGQFDALVDFVYNVGEGSVEKKIDGLATSTLLRLLNAGDYAGAQAQFARWNKNDGQVMRGLIRRRAAQAALFSGLNGSAAIAAGVAAA